LARIFQDNTFTFVKIRSAQKHSVIEDIPVQRIFQDNIFILVKIRSAQSMQSIRMLRYRYVVHPRVHAGLVFRLEKIGAKEVVVGFGLSRLPGNSHGIRVERKILPLQGRKGREGMGGKGGEGGEGRMEEMRVGSDGRKEGRKGGMEEKGKEGKERK
jgi:hypothetical protein